MGEINLSKAVRSNLLSLQSTAAAMASTQQRLATGLKVNSALDNPTNFFTAASLNSRAGDMANLLDSMSNGVKTIEAADNGLSSITKTVESMQSTLRQARQDKSFKSTSYSIDDLAAGGTIELSGGAVGSVPVSVALGGVTPVQSEVTASADYLGPSGTQGSHSFTFSPNATPWVLADSVLVGVSVDGNPDVVMNLIASDLPQYGNADNKIDNIDEFVDDLNWNFNFYSLGATATHDGTTITVSSNTFGTGSSLSFTSVDGDADGGGLNATFGMTVGGGTPGLAGTGNKQITIGNGSKTADITLTSGNAATVGQARSYIQSQLSAQGVTGVTVGGTGQRIDLTGTANGSTSITIGGADADDVFGASAVTTPAVYGGELSASEIAQQINSNAALSGKVRASVDKDRVRIENLSTAELTVRGASNGVIDGSTSEDEVDGNNVRANLAKQFNDLRDQLDKFADDASFNGINLLRGDKLKLTFNETGTSTIDIQAKDAEGDPTSVSNSTLGIEWAADSDLDSDEDIDARLDRLKDALGQLRSLASSFGSNLSIVQNRTDFTKKMINTLETGAANLTLADTNEEAANLLALQTRQQLSSTALSMASQGDQAVLRLF